ncbi:Mal regulon transcriptional regulator MalI, partial [Enterobacter mori]
CYNDVIAMGAWFGLIRAGRQSGEGGVETFFGHQVALGAFGALGAKPLDAHPNDWGPNPAPENWETLGDRKIPVSYKQHTQAPTLGPCLTMWWADQ